MFVPSGLKLNFLRVSLGISWSWGPRPHIFTRWHVGLEEKAIDIQDEWKEACKEDSRETCETKPQRFQYKLNRILPCKTYLGQIRVKDFFYQCGKVQPFRRSVCSWIRQKENSYLDHLTVKEYIMGLVTTKANLSMLSSSLDPGFGSGRLEGGLAKGPLHTPPSLTPTLPSLSHSVLKWVTYRADTTM